MTNEHTQEKHTPLPWEKSPKYSPNQDEYIEIIKGGVIIARIYNSNFQQGIKRGEGEANAEYIVKCVTAYPSLVEALEAFILATDNHPSPAAREHYLPLIVKAQAARKHT